MEIQAARSPKRCDGRGRAFRAGSSCGSFDGRVLAGVVLFINEVATPGILRQPSCTDLRGVSDVVVRWTGALR